MIYDKSKYSKLKSFLKECIKLFSSENRQMGVKVGLKNNKRRYVTKMTIGHYHLQKVDVQYMNIRKISVGFKKNI